MRLGRIAVITLALALGACAGPHSQKMRNAWPAVQISGDQVQAVNPDPLRFRPDMGAVVITWRLPAGDYRFGRAGIVIDAELDRPGGKPISREQTEIGDCRALADGRQFQCVYRNTRPGAFKYSVHVSRAGKALPPLDPEITNME